MIDKNGIMIDAREPVEIKERDWIDQLLCALLSALIAAGSWWIWVWAFNLTDVPTWVYFFAAWVGFHVPIPKFYIRRKRK